MACCAGRTSRITRRARARTAFADYLAQFGHARVDGQLCVVAVGCENGDGFGHVCARGQSVPQHDRRLFGAGCARPQDGRRSRELSRSGRRIEQAERADSARPARPRGACNRFGRAMTILVSVKLRRRLREERRDRDNGDHAVRDQDPAAGSVLEAGSQARVSRDSDRFDAL